jgi:hypothetical protein
MNIMIGATDKACACADSFDDSQQVECLVEPPTYCWHRLVLYRALLSAFLVFCEPFVLL